MSANVKDIERLALRSQAPIPIEGGDDVLLVPNDFRIESTEKFSIRPTRLRRNLSVTTVESYVSYFNSFKNQFSRQYADLDQVTVRGVLDDHESAELGGARWCDHWVIYSCPFSREWKAWTGNDRQRMNQLDFARFLEDRISEVTNPSGADLLDLALELEIKRDVTYRSANRLESGEITFAYTEENATGGTVEIPAEFELALPVFRSGTVYSVKARLRYRLSSGNLELWYELIEPDKYVEDAFTEVCVLVESECERPVFLAQLV